MYVRVIGNTLSEISSLAPFSCSSRALFWVCRSTTWARALCKFACRSCSLGAGPPPGAGRGRPCSNNNYSKPDAGIMLNCTMISIPGSHLPRHSFRQRLGMLMTGGGIYGLAAASLETDSTPYV